MKMSDQRLVCEDQIIQEIRNTPEEYLPNLLQIIRLFRESITLKPAELTFRQGLKEATSGQTMPVSELWDDIEVEVK
jgi:hypothetical protein